MRVIVEDVNGNKFSIKEIIELTFLQSWDAPCDAVMLTYTDKVSSELYSIQVYDKYRLIFNGFVDNQRSKVDDKGNVNSLYARSSASILVDSKAQPFTYSKPTTAQLFINNIDGSVFKNRLPDLACEYSYEVPLGTSLFGAINSFVSLLLGVPAYVDVDNNLRLRGLSEKALILDDDRVLSLTKTINRSLPLGEIAFKENINSQYIIHTKSRYAEALRLNKMDLVNLTALPKWQRENTVKNKLQSSFEDYKIMQVLINGYCDYELGQRFKYAGDFGEFDDYVLKERKYTHGKNGESTLLVLKKNIDIGGFTYVDK